MRTSLTIYWASFELCSNKRTNRVEVNVQGNNQFFILCKTKENANYSPERRLCSFAAAQFETSPFVGEEKQAKRDFEHDLLKHNLGQKLNV